MIYWPIYIKHGVSHECGILSDHGGVIYYSRDILLLVRGIRHIMKRLWLVFVLWYMGQVYGERSGKAGLAALWRRCSVAGCGRKPEGQVDAAFEGRYFCAPYSMY